MQKMRKMNIPIIGLKKFCNLADAYFKEVLKNGDAERISLWERILRLRNPKELLRNYTRMSEACIGLCKKKKKVKNVELVLEL